MYGPAAQAGMRGGGLLGDVTELDKNESAKGGLTCASPLPFQQRPLL